MWLFHWLVNEQTEEPGWLKILTSLSIGGANWIEENICNNCVHSQEGISTSYNLTCSFQFQHYMKPFTDEESWANEIEWPTVSLFPINPLMG